MNSIVPPRPRAGVNRGRHRNVPSPTWQRKQIMPADIAPPCPPHDDAEVPPDERSAAATGGPSLCTEIAPREFLTRKDARQLARVLLAMTQDEFTARIKGSPMKRATLRGLKRNAAVVLGNAGARTATPEPHAMNFARS
jgi:hypothetical protein